MIDLRSDTVTMPSDEMREIMSKALVGDAVYGEDPSVNELQDFTAELLGKEAAIFLPSGTMGNQLGLKINTKAGDEVIVENDAHIYYYETAGPSIISQVQLRVIPSDSGMPDLNKIESCIRPDIYYFPKTTLICLENTHNRHGGTVIDLDYIKDVKMLADKYGIKMHLDGARLWNASVETGISMKEYSEAFDTINICLSKGLGAPIGSLLVGSKESITMALKWRKILGGGMRQAGIIAAGGLYAIKNNFDKLKDDHENAKLFGNEINKCDYIDCDLGKVQTNMVIFECINGMISSKLHDELITDGLLVHEVGDNKIRAVFHLHITKEIARTASEIVISTAKKIMDN
jgi:threonine aldolase